MAVGIILNKKVGEAVGLDDVLAYLHGGDKDSSEAAAMVQEAYLVQEGPVLAPTLIYDIIS